MAKLEDYNIYKNYNRQSEISRLFMSMFSYLAMGHVFDEDLSLYDNLNADKVYTYSALDTDSCVEDIIYRESQIVDNLCKQLMSAHEHVHTNGLFFERVPVKALSKDDIAKIIFDDLNWAKVYANLNVGSLVMPPRV